jgi:hypothetical protein
MIEIDGFSSHRPVLEKILRQINNPKVIELGIGFGSTPLIVELSEYSEHYDTEQDWINKFTHLFSENHIFNKINNYSKFEWNEDIFQKNWDVAFIDNAPGESRQSNLIKLKDKSKFIICHDTEELYKEAASDYRWDFSNFKYHYVYTEYNTYTTIVSNFENIIL